MDHCKTCKTCKHWKPCVIYDRFANWNTKEDGRAGGTCKSDKLIEDGGRGHDADMLVYAYNEGGSFWTGPDFGCVHHQRIDP